MSLKLEIIAESDFLRINATGDFSLEEAQRTFLEVLAAVAKFKVKKVLIDGREITGSPEFIERFYYGKFTAESVWEFLDRGVSPATQFAYVMIVPLRDPGRFGETVAVNRGVCLRTFDNPEDALEWLETTPVQ